MTHYRVVTYMHIFPKDFTVLESHVSVYAYRAQVCISESLAAQMPNSPFRRPPSSVVSFTSKSDNIVRLPSVDFVKESTEDILKVAKDDLSRLKLKEHRKRVSTCTIFVTNTLLVGSLYTCIVHGLWNRGFGT